MIGTLVLLALSWLVALWVVCGLVRIGARDNDNAVRSLEEKS